MADVTISYVEPTGVQAANTFVPIIVRTPAGDTSATVGFSIGTSQFNGVTDPEISFGYYAPPGGVTSTFQLEGNWDVGVNGQITEMYWQIVKTDGTTSRRPFFGKYSRTDQRSVAWYFMIGNGRADDGTQPQAFQVNWDDDTGQVGVSCFSVTPNRMSLYGVTTGGVSADQTRLRLYSAAGQGSAVAWTYNGADAEGTANPTFVLYSTSAAQMNAKMNNTFWGSFIKPSATQPGIVQVSGIQLGDGSGARAAIYSANGVPSSGMGANGDWALSNNGHIYAKAAGAWSQVI